MEHRIRDGSVARVPGCGRDFHVEWRFPPLFLLESRRLDSVC